MKGMIVLPQKLKIALLLAAVMAVIVLTSFINNNNITKMQHNAASIYQDRLIPATEFFLLSDNLYRKRFILDNYLQSNTVSKSTKLVLSELHRLDGSIDSLIMQYEQTYLVEAEEIELKQLKRKLSEYRSIEHDIFSRITQNTNKQYDLFKQKGEPSFQAVLAELKLLNSIQTKEGEELASLCHSEASGSKLIMYVQILLVFIIGAIVQSIILAHKTTLPIPTQNMHLN